MTKGNGAMNEKDLTKGELRKLTALRKSLGAEIADEAFMKWRASMERHEASDPNVALIEDALNPLLDKMRFPRGLAYAIRRGRGRFVIELVDLGR